MSTATATDLDDAIRVVKRRFNPVATGMLWIATGGLFQVYWYWDARRLTARELGKGEVRPLLDVAAMVAIWALAVFLLFGSGDGQLEAIGLTLIPAGWAPFMYRAWRDIDLLRDKIGAPRFPARAYAASLVVPILMLWVGHYLLKSLTLGIYTDARAVFDATGYAFMVAWPYTFAFGVGYLNEYWTERAGAPDFTSIAEDLTA
jgi:hypothetical protein